MTAIADHASPRFVVAAAALVAALPVPALAPAAGGGLAAALRTGTRRHNAGLGAAVGLLGGLGYLVGWTVLAFVISGTVPPELPDGGAFEGFALFVLALDVLGGAAGGVLGGGLARRARARPGDEERPGFERPE